MRILQFGFFDSLNIGDRLIAEEIHKQYLENHEIKALSYLGQPVEELENICVLSRKITKKNKIKKKIRILIPYHPNKKIKKQVKQWIYETDCLVFSGGNLLFDLNKYSKSYLKLKWILELAKQQNKPVIALSVGIGPFRTMNQEKKTIELLNKLDYISVRDKKSAAYFKKQIPIVQDPVFTSEFFTTLAKRLFRQDENRIAVSIIDYRLAGASEEQYIIYINQMSEILLQLSKKYEITIFSTETRDYSAVTEIYHRLKGTVKKVDVCSKEALYALYENSSLIIGTRMHSMIFAVAAKIPVIGIAWQDKVEEMFKILDDQASCFAIDKLEQQKFDLYKKVKQKMTQIENERYLLEETKKEFENNVSEEKKRVNKLLVEK
ncbi:polysaccharide pyruvyl transferase [Enterococcus faecalis 13-SD-W-01]|nr:polysaccharide pyruvyl transferase [Enterococcus faecalis 13-SD-W-01]